MNSSNKCDRLVEEDLERSFEVKDLTRTVVKSVGNEVDLVTGY